MSDDRELLEHEVEALAQADAMERLLDNQDFGVFIGLVDDVLKGTRDSLATGAGSWEMYQQLCQRLEALETVRQLPDLLIEKGNQIRGIIENERSRLRPER